MPLERRIEDSSRQAAKSLTNRLLLKSDETITALERSPSFGGLTSSDCFRLWSQLGMLSDKGWSKLLPSTEQGPIATRIDDLEARLRRLLSRTKKELLTCVESGILEIVDDMRKSQEEFLSLLEKGKLNTTIPSIELNAELLSLRDDLGYASFLLERLGVEISPPVFAKIMSLDQHLRRLLPRVVALYRSAEDDPTPYPDLFPKSFWWRQIR